MIIQNADVLKADFTFGKGDICVSGQRFSDCGEGDVIDGTGLYAIPGLVDIHLHGCMGYDFCDGTEESLDKITQYQAQNGITSICPTTMSLPEQSLLTICRQIAAYSGMGAALAGITLEGPFFSTSKKGAQNAAYLQHPSIAMYERLQAASDNRIKTVCIAPELPGAMDFISHASKTCRVSIAHTAADYETAVQAFQAGACHVTHLLNAMPPFHHRDPGVVGAAVDSKADVEVICDGIHLHPSMIRSILKLFGTERTILISDSMMATGLPDGNYTLGRQDVQVKNRHALLADGTIAGSTSNLMDCVRMATLFGVPLATAVKLASYNPARAMGLEEEIGSIQSGKIANFVLLDKALQVVCVFINGEKIPL